MEPNFSVVDRFPCIQVCQVWVLLTPDPEDYKSFPLKTNFRYAQAPFKVGFTVFIYFRKGLSHGAVNHNTREM